MLKALQPQTMDKYSLSIAIDGTTGDGIKACLWAGAHTDEVHTAMVFDRVAVKPDEFGGSDTVGSLFWMGSNPWPKVNLNGERFTNERHADTAAPYRCRHLGLGLRTVSRAVRHPRMRTRLPV